MAATNYHEIIVPPVDDLSDAGVSILTMLISPVILLIAGLVAMFTEDISSFLAPWPFLLAIFLVGLPHGAVDLTVIRKLAGKSQATVLLWCSGYVACMGIIIILLLYIPVTVLGGFGLLSAWHFGRADVSDLIQINALKRTHGQENTFRALSRGSMIILLPFCFHFKESVAVINGLLEICGHEFITTTSLLQPFMGLIVIGLVVVEVSGVIQSWLSGGALRALVQFTEVLALVTAFATLHPLFAMGLYFIVWHSWRHMQRLNRILYRDDTGFLGLRRVISLHNDSLILLLPTIVAILGVAWFMGGGISPLSLALSSILTYVVVTLPHELLCQQIYHHLGTVKFSGEAS
jgi:Brp/Blh family beta-carotene 15,15'-monooxygenase